MFHPRGRFIGSLDNVSEADTVLFGAPFDGTTSFMPGTRFGPDRIRDVSDGIETYSPLLDRDLGNVGFFDIGNVDIPFGNPGQVLTEVEAATDSILDMDKRPLLLGGEHLVSLGTVRSLVRRYPDLCVLQFDAHADLREDYVGEKYSHATVMRHMVELVGGNNVFQLGIRSGNREEIRYGRKTTRFYPHEIVGPLKEIWDELHGRPLYVTIDIDVVDPAFAPGTGTPEPGGCTSRELLEAVCLLDGLRWAGCDVVEVCPPGEQGVVTALLGAKIVRELLLLK